MKRITRPLLLSLLVFSFLLLAASAASPLRAETNSITNPILFVTQVPVPQDYTTVGSVIGNQQGTLDAAPRGGDLYIRYPNGDLKNLTRIAHYGLDDTTPGACKSAAGCQGVNAIAVRDPSMYWDGSKAIFSMVIGAPTAAWQENTYHWQLYEITGLRESDSPSITKVPNQPDYNNISPTYGSDDRILFTSDRPRGGENWLYPQRDEYESAPTVTGIWSLNPANGDLFQLDHAVSGAFTPFVDSYGRVIFTRWDHLQRDQQADTDYEDNAPFAPTSQNGGCAAYCTFNYADESQQAQRLATRNEVYPEPRSSRTDLLQGTNLNGNGFNDFGPWQINEDGTQEETLNHIGRHELIGYFEPSFNDDPQLTYCCNNSHQIENFLQIEQDPTNSTRYFGIDAPEFFTHGGGQVISINGAPSLNADQMSVTYWTARSTSSFSATAPADFTGHYRDILPLSSGTLVASLSAYPDLDSDPHPGNNQVETHYDFHLVTLKQLQNSAYWGGDTALTGGISKNVSWWSPDTLMTYSGPLWEWEPVEVRARTRPQKIVDTLPSVEKSVFDNVGVDVATFQQYLKDNNLALFVSRNVTQRDDADFQQPFNLRIPNGIQTLSKNYHSGDKIYSMSYLQFFQGDQVRGMGGTVHPYAGRRVIAQYMHDPAALAANPTLNGAPQSSVQIAADGSVAAFVPARRAMTWQTTDANGTGVVRERMWITFQPGEIRVCTSCHGVNTLDQAGNPTATNVPEALTDIMTQWKNSNGNTCNAKPSAPSLLTPTNGAKASARAVPLDWSDVACVTKYKVIVKVGSSKGTLADKNNNLTQSQYTTIKLAKNTQYVWRVSACNAHGCINTPWAKFKTP